MATDSRASRLREVIALFLRLGTVGFGGPVAHMAFMEDEVVRQRQWLTPSEFVTLLGLVNVIPGPNSTELAMAIGHRRAGWLGLVAAGIAFILPAATLTSLLAFLYVEAGQLPDAGRWLAGAGPAVVAIMAAASVRIGPAAVPNIWYAGLALLVCGLSLAGVAELPLLLGAGGACGAVVLAGRLRGATALWVALLVALLGTAAVAGAAVPPPAASQAVSPMSVWWFFLKVGAVLYGGGYVLVALLDPLVGQGWLTSRELVDAVAAGQITPGPVLTTATFVGYLVAGLPGAAAGTVGIFLPAFLLVGWVRPIGRWAAGHEWARAVLGGINAAAVALILAVTVRLAADVLVGWPAIALALVCIALAFSGQSAVIVLLVGMMFGAALGGW